jgi:glutathione S-transferase
VRFHWGAIDGRVHGDSARVIELRLMLKIYGQPKSRTFRVLWLCKESAIAYEHIPVTIKSEDAQCREPWYLALNPNGRIPTIDDDGFVMWESWAINIYLAKKYGSALYPRSMSGEGRMLQWAFYVANDIETPMNTLNRNRIIYPPEKRDPVVAAEAEKTLQPKLKILEDQLSQTAYFGGDHWDMSDFMVASVLYTFFGGKHDLSAFPKLNAWLVASVERPAAKEVRKLRE